MTAANENTPPLVLWPHQVAAVNAIEAEHEAGRLRTLIEVATGAGKSRVIGEVGRREVERGGRVLALAPRVEIADQLAQAFTSCGLRAAIEQGARKAPPDADVVVASVATLKGARLERWPRDHFTLLVADEAHHSVSSSWRQVFDWFPDAKALGTTATADRLDGVGLGQMFQSVAFRYPLRQAIRDGWLVPIRARRVKVDGLDLAHVHTKCGDLDQGELAAVMEDERALHGVCVPLLEMAGGRPSVLFAVNVAHARALAEVLCRYKPDVARAVDGSMPANVRAELLADFAAGRFQIVVNVALLTEGWDCPRVSLVAMARPTKSRALFTQCIGRATRLAPGKVDALILDFVGNAGRHRLIGPADVLADRNLPDDVRDELSGLLDGDHGDLDDVLELAESAANENRAKAAITAMARYRAEEIDPFVGDLLEMPRTPWAGDLASDKQREALGRAGLEDAPAELTKGEASRWLDAIAARRSAGLATVRQVRLLKRYAIDARTMLIADATAAINRIRANGWRKTWAA